MLTTGTPTGDAEPSEATLSLADLLAIVERRRAWIAGVTGLCLLAGTAFVLGRAPEYRASATLLIDGHGTSTGVLAQLAAISSAPAASSEMAILRSREVAVRTVEPPAGLDLGDPERRSDARHLALTTLVDDLGQAPLAQLWSVLGQAGSADDAAAELHARVRARAPEAPESVQIEFTGPRRVRISRAGALTRISGGALGAAGETLDFAPGEPLRYAGLEIELGPTGDLTGRRFRVSAWPIAEAVERVMQQTVVEELERNSGVVCVTVSDSDAQRAARIANALCANYLALNVLRGQKSAGLATDFIDTQLEAQIAALERAEEELVRLQAAAPETIDLETTARVLIEQLSGLEVEKMQSQLMLAALGEATRLLEAGRFEALSQLQVQLADPVTLGYLQAITGLVAESEQQDRSDTGTYKLLLQTKLGELRTQVEALTLRHAELARIAAGLEGGDASALARLAEDPEHTDPITLGYLEELALVEARVAQTTQELTESHPDVVRDRRTIGELRELVRAQLASRLAGLASSRDETGALAVEYEALLARQADDERGHIGGAVARLTQRTLAHLGARARGLESHVTALDGEIAGCERRLGSFPETQRLQADPLRRLKTHEQIVELLLQSRQEAELSKASTVATAEMIDAAVPPREPAFPRPVPVLGLAFVLGLALGIGSAFVRERLRGSITTEAELEAVTQLSVLGAIPRFRGRAGFGRRHALAMRDDPEGLVAEAYRSICANLRYAFEGDCVRTLAVTSCAPKEGKSTTNIDLALGFAAIGKRVLLVDADLRKPVVGRYLELPAGPGLAEVLETGLAWREAVHATRFAGLEVMLAGKARRSPLELLSQGAVSPFVAELRAAYDVVVFDVPPALAVADVRMFARELDGVLLLYRSEGLPAAAVRSAVRKLEQSGARILGCLLNAVRPLRYGGSYEGYYAYGYEGSARARRAPPSQVA